ncbi:MAG: hypothetical protein J0H75_11870 [Rhizobiales bacterium]|nr:hypothetical protein [Hyphomicrobiales bacterium]
MSGQGAILGLPQLRDADGQPDSRGGQDNGENEGCEIRQHPMPELVLVARDAMTGGLAGISIRLSGVTPRWRRGESARGKFDDARTVLGLG